MTRVSAVLLLSSAVLASVLAKPVNAAAPTRLSTAADEDLEQRLAAARDRLAKAAGEVAELSTQLGAQAADGIYYAQQPSRVSLGVQIDPNSGREGARVLAVSPGGPASEAGVRAGDVITAIDGVAITGRRSAHQLIEQMRSAVADRPLKLHILRSYQPGERATLRIMRHQKPMTLSVSMPDAGRAEPQARAEDITPR